MCMPPPVYRSTNVGFHCFSHYNYVPSIHVENFKLKTIQLVSVASPIRTQH